MATGGLGLPQEVMIEILLRLPINDLVQLRCVSKEWRDLISDPSFQNLIRRRSRNNPLFFMLHSGFEGLNPTCKFSLMDMSGTIRNQFTVQVAEHIEWPFVSYSYCNLLCILIGKDLCVCNPSTQQFVKLPESPHNEHLYCCSYGIGFLPSSNQYKIIRIFQRDENSRSTGCEVFTLKDGVSIHSGTWKLVGDCPCGSRVQKSGGLSVNGAMFWLIYDPSSEAEKILSMGLEAEEFGFVCCPEPHYDHTTDSCSYLIELKGFLCMVRTGPKLVIWKLKDCKNGTWFMEYNIDFAPLNNFNLVLGYIHTDADNDDDDDVGELLISCQQVSYLWYSKNKIRREKNLLLQKPKPQVVFVYYDHLFFLGNSK